MTSSARQSDLVLRNARVLTMDPRRPAAGAVAVRQGRVVWVGADGDLAGSVPAGARVIDCGGATLLPGFVDAHCHVLAYAASLLAVDCSPDVAGSIADIVDAIRVRVRSTPPGKWIRAAGYDEVLLDEGRHPTRLDLDEAAPNHPVRLNHGSGHACVLNSMALSQAGISSSTPEPAGGVIDREVETGDPAGLLLEMDEFLAGRIPPLGEAELREGLRAASGRLLSYGVTSVHDATHSNSPGRWDLLSEARSSGAFVPRVTMMMGAAYIDEFRGRRFASGPVGADVDVGPVKIMLTSAGGELTPSPDELRNIVRRADKAGWQVALHAVDAEAVDAAVEVLLESSGAATGRRHRIEHLAECSDQTLGRLKGSGIVVGTNPAFIHYRGRRYLRAVETGKLGRLYRFGSLLRVGVTVAAGSDAPVVEPNPLAAVAGAVTRRVRPAPSTRGELSRIGEQGRARPAPLAGGEPSTIGEPEGVPVMEALRMCTASAACAAFQEGDRGSIEVRKLADMVLLDRDPTRVEPDELSSIQVLMTVLGGKVVWER